MEPSSVGTKSICEALGMVSVFASKYVGPSVAWMDIGQWICEVLISTQGPQYGVALSRCVGPSEA